MQQAPHSPYAARNSEPILAVLLHELSDCQKVLEIGSGTGQHAVRFAAALPDLQWQTSDLDANHAGINAAVSESGLPNLKPAISLDARTSTIAADFCDGIFSANTAHIMSKDAAQRMFEIVATGLKSNGVFCLYGPFRHAGEFNAASNASFHSSLRSQDRSMGIRDIESLDIWAATNGLSRRRWYAMPANNYLAVWQKENK